MGCFRAIDESLQRRFHSIYGQTVLLTNQQPWKKANINLDIFFIYIKSAIPSYEITFVHVYVSVFH